MPWASAGNSSDQYPHQMNSTTTTAFVPEFPDYNGTDESDGSGYQETLTTNLPDREVEILLEDVEVEANETILFT